MIRIIQNKIIIPKGDTGYFNIPYLKEEIEENVIAVFSLFDPLKHETILEKIIPVEEEILTFSFQQGDTINLEPKKYNWDIKIYKNPEFDEDEQLIDGEEIDSYFAAYSLPTFEVKEVAKK